MTLPHPQADDLLRKGEAYKAKMVSLDMLRAATGEAAAVAVGELKESLVWAKTSCDATSKSAEPGSDDEHRQANPVVDEVEPVLRQYLDSA
jgi:hypothetical protein